MLKRTALARNTKRAAVWLDAPVPVRMARAATPLPPSSPTAVLLIIFFFLLAGGVSALLYNTGPGAECREHTQTRNDGVVVQAAYYTDTLPDGTRWQVCRFGADNVWPPKKIK